MPVWHARAQKYVDQGRLAIVGLIQEQHPDRCRLFMQWKGMDWPILVDALNLYGVDAVPITYAIDEAHIPAFAFGSGDLTVHEVATDPQSAKFAYLSYYAGGLRSLEIRCQGNSGNCKLVEVGGYLDPDGNNFWGVEAFVRDGCTYIAGSDRDSGLWLFKRTDSCQ